MWIAQNGSLCYFSKKEDKRLVLLDAHHLPMAIITRFENGAKEHAFIIKTKPDHDEHDDHEHDATILACDSELDYEAWIHACKRSKEEMIQTMKLGANMAGDLRKFKLNVKNRRRAIGEADNQDHQF